jgi:ATP-dependent 26S proteasome regulatory subunit
MTTNRPDQIEPALASRPGRIDQAIEFGLPDEEGRAKLTKLYAGGLDVSEQLLRESSAVPRAPLRHS